LDPFENILSEVNGMTGGSGGLESATRIEYHVIHKLLADFLPNYNYNSSTERFIRSKETTEDDPDRDGTPTDQNTEYIYKYGTKQMDEDYGEIMKLYRGFIGKEHFNSMVRLLGYSGISFILSYAVIPCANTHIKHMVLPYYLSLKVIEKVPQKKSKTKFRI